MDDEVLARLPALVGVVLAGEHERLHDAVAVDGLRDLVRVLLDDREEVRQQILLDLREVGRDRAARHGMRRRAVHRPVCGDRDRAIDRAARDGRFSCGAV